MSLVVVVFDWDGTVIDSLEIKIGNAGKIFHRLFGVPAEQVEAAYRRNSGVPRRQLFGAICRETGLPPLSEQQYQELSAQFSEMNIAAVIGAACSPGAASSLGAAIGSSQQLIPAETWTALEALSRQGHPLYVSTASDQSEVRGLAKSLGLDHYFVEILGSSPGFGKGKEHIEYIRQQQPVPAAQIVMVGDEPTDIQLGQAAGATTVAKAGTYPPAKLAEAGADFVIDTLAGLPAVLEKIQK